LRVAQDDFDVVEEAQLHARCSQDVVAALCHLGLIEQDFVGGSPAAAYDVSRAFPRVACDRDRSGNYFRDAARDDRGLRLCALLFHAGGQNLGFVPCAVEDGEDAQQQAAEQGRSED
jgi:hypothetical protein